MKLLSYFIFFLIIYFYFFNKLETFTNYNDKLSIGYNNKLSIIYNDIFQSIFNQYNLYITRDDITLGELLSNKCYITKINNIYEYDTKPWLKLLSIITIIDYINTKCNQLNINNVTKNTNIILLQQSYIINFCNQSYLKSKNSNHIYHYYNNMINLKQCFDNIAIMLYNKEYDNLRWIDLVYLMFINYNIIYLINKEETIDILSDKYNKILIIGDFILNEIIKYAIGFHNVTDKYYNNITSKSYLKNIKDIVLYIDDGLYFKKNHIFDCSI